MLGIIWWVFGHYGIISKHENNYCINESYISQFPITYRERVMGDDVLSVIKHVLHQCQWGWRRTNVVFIKLRESKDTSLQGEYQFASVVERKWWLLVIVSVIPWLLYVDFCITYRTPPKCTFCQTVLTVIYILIDCIWKGVLPNSIPAIFIYDYQTL